MSLENTGRGVGELKWGRESKNEMCIIEQVVTVDNGDSVLLGISENWCQTQAPELSCLRSEDARVFIYQLQSDIDS